jgi:hypothetical protein
LCSIEICLVPCVAAVQANLVKQLGKLVKVRYVEDITSAKRVGEWQHGSTGIFGHPASAVLVPSSQTVSGTSLTPVCYTERDLMLIKLRAPAGPACTEALQLAELTPTSTHHLTAHKLCYSATVCQSHACSTPVCHAERELMLIKLRAPAGPARTEVLQLAEIFRARVVDVSERGLTLCVSGDPGKVRQCLYNKQQSYVSAAFFSAMFNTTNVVRVLWM